MALVKTLKSSPQNFTGAWANYGDEIGTDGKQTIALWLNIVINDTQGARFRIIARHASGGEEYILPINIVTASVVKVADEYYEIIPNQSAKRIVSFTLDRVVPFVQIQIKAGVEGATPGQILSSKYTLA